ncbi:helix-turn-helix domain-containing protein [Streptomyces sp. AV19]|uniref:helix-turn-helix domain-containing protein n=1 Tax=Streptomyces sp. AV19 TaxID=2793068 RepID=UPI0024139798|nr:helix-turn-helix domain-containing protein [Streptomyces sp. AV19]MDG4531171.1 helix-turn-helix domain-containing protein [Streptomyces sp. AV19]
MHIRHRHTSQFTVVGNHFAQNQDLSLVALGIGLYVQSLPDGAVISIKALSGRFKEGDVLIARALRELEEAGYLERERVRTEEGRVVTVTRWHEWPRTHPRPPVEPTECPAPPPRVKPEPRPEPPLPPVDQPAADLLAALRRHDPRLVLSEKDVRRLAPAVRAWLDRDIGPHQITRTLTADLPVGRIPWPARLLRYRLTSWLPPQLPTTPLEPRPAAPPRPDPLQTCDGCDRAFRAPAPGLCRDCRTAAGKAA